MSRFVRVAVMLVVALAVGSASFAGCLPGDPRPMDEMACCQHDRPDCGPAMRRADCCLSSASTPQNLIATKPVPSTKFLMALSALTSVVSAVPIVRLETARTATSAPSSSPPTFLLLPLRI